LSTTTRGELMVGSVAEGVIAMRDTNYVPYV